MWQYDDVIRCLFVKRDTGDNRGHLPNELAIMNSMTHVIDLSSEPARAIGRLPHIKQSRTSWTKVGLIEKLSVTRPRGCQAVAGLLNTAKLKEMSIRRGNYPN
jgi:hypothetical protein